MCPAGVRRFAGDTDTPHRRLGAGRRRSGDLRRRGARRSAHGAPLRGRQHRGTQHRRRVLAGGRRDADAAPGLAVHDRRRGHGAGDRVAGSDPGDARRTLRPRGRRRQQQHLGPAHPPGREPPARRHRLLGRRAARQHRRAPGARVRGERRSRRCELHRVHAERRRTPRPDRGIHVRPAGRCAARRRVLLAGRHQARRNADQHVADRQLRRGCRRSPDGRSRLAVPGPGRRPVRKRVPSDELVAALRLERPQRRHRRNGLGLRRRRRRHAQLDRVVAVPRLPVRSVLGRDLTTGTSCSRSTPRRRASRAMRSQPTARSRCSGRHRSHGRVSRPPTRGSRRTARRSTRSSRRRTPSPCSPSTAAA